MHAASVQVQSRRGCADAYEVTGIRQEVEQRPVAVGGRGPLVTPAVQIRGPRRRLYLRIRTRFLLSVLAGAVWVAFSAWLALGWIGDLAGAITLPGAIFVVAGMALVPGYLSMQLAAALLLDRPPKLSFDLDFPPITLVVAAFNEADRIRETLVYAQAQDYPGPVEIVVVDDGSTDTTRAIVRSVASVDARVSLLQAPHLGKALALDAALATVTTPLLATIDADTLLMPDALRRATARLLLSPPDTVAVAGSIMARNSRMSVATRIQQWDYFLGIASVKREQAMLQGTLVAQGAFSVYDTEALRRVGGWPDMIGEDIVLTWALLRNGGRTTHEPTAFAFTDTPTGLRAFIRQRQRWARGMIEGLARHGGPLLRRRRLYAHSIASDLLFPYLDLVYTFAVPIGIGLAVTGDYAIIGPLTLAVLPINALLSMLMFGREARAFHEAGLHVRHRARDITGLVLYLLVYQIVTSPASICGYAKEIVGARRAW